jgi:hypothetical protein
MTEGNWRYLQQSIATRCSDEGSTLGETGKDLLMEARNITKKDQAS